MKNILFIGGTQFFGKKAVDGLIAKGHQVTVATRGNTPLPFKKEVPHITLDAHIESHPGWEEVTAQKWDAVYHSLIYTMEDAELISEKLDGITEHFYYTSSMAVYPTTNIKGGYREEDFDPWEFEINPLIEVDYGEGKRQAEAFLFTQAPFDVTAFRFPIVLDNDDYTERLHFYIEQVLQEETLYFDDPEHKVNYIKGTTAADAIVWAIENEKEGIYNVATTDAITISTFVEWLEKEIGKEVQVTYQHDTHEKSPFSFSHDSYVISDKIMQEGFELDSLESWLRPLIRELSQELSEDID